MRRVALLLTAGVDVDVGFEFGIDESFDEGVVFGALQEKRAEILHQRYVIFREPLGWDGIEYPSPYTTAGRNRRPRGTTGSRLVCGIS
jgi:hypothetical protein